MINLLYHITVYLKSYDLFSNRDDVSNDGKYRSNKGPIFQQKQFVFVTANNLHIKKVDSNQQLGTDNSSCIW